MTVSVNIHARDMNVSPRLREYCEKKAGKLDRFLPALSEVRMDLAEARNARSADDRHVAQITVHARQAVLRAEERKDDIYAAVDAVLDKIERQIERYKGKHWRNRGDGASADSLIAAAEAEEMPAETEPSGAVVRRKRFPVAPMNELEAMEHMQLLGHDDFFVFYNAESNRINVLYRRRDGDFGLIDPEIS